MIISANELNENTREKIIDLFCESLMNKIKKANAKGGRKTVFDATIFCNEKTNELSIVYRTDWKEDGILPYKYLFEDYEKEIEERFVKFGYVVKPTGYIGGVWQLTKDIMW